jgi:hypothetical protein
MARGQIAKMIEGVVTNLYSNPNAKTGAATTDFSNEKYQGWNSGRRRLTTD